MNFYFIFISFQSGVSIINKANRQYNCKFCSEEFKWQYELLKHCVFRHFLDDIKKDLPDEFPAKCPKCEFTGRNRSTLVLHYGVTHRVIQKLIEDAQSNPESVANKLRAPPRGATAASTSASASQQSQVERPFSCPLCSLKVSRRQQMDHLCTHFSERLSQRLPASGPFACPDCRFVGTDRRRLVRHYGGHHGHAHALLVEHLRDAGKDVTAADVVKQERVLSGGETTRIPPPPEFAFECQLCDSLPVYKNKSELCKHLSESHFMERIMSELPPLPVLVSGDGGDSLPGAADGAEGLKAFKCNRPGCNYSSTTRNSLLTHVAVFHRVALKLYLDVVGQSELPNDVGGDPRLGWDDRVGHGGGGGGGGRSAEAVLRRQQAAAASLETPCAICGEKFDRSSLVHHVAETHFPDKIAGLSREAPFKCPQCPHFAENREKLLRHFGFYHKVFDKITADQMKIEPTDAIDVKSELESSTGGDTPKTSDAQSDAGNATPLHLPEIKDEIMTEVMEKKPEDAGSNPAANAVAGEESRSTPTLGKSVAQQCLMCDDCRFVGTSTTDFHKHLCDVHFKERLIALVQTVQGEAGKRYRCPECGYEHQYRFQIARHCGLKHLFAKKFYSEVTGEKFDPELEEAAKRSRGRPTVEMALMAAIDSKSSGTDNYNCKICSARSLGLADYLKHLSKIHFKSKLLSMVPSTEPFICPFDGCGLEKKDHLALAVHYGINHKEWNLDFHFVISSNFLPSSYVS